jgi:hypothetical protein
MKGPKTWRNAFTLFNETAGWLADVASCTGFSIHKVKAGLPRSWNNITSDALVRRLTAMLMLAILCISAPQTSTSATVPAAPQATAIYESTLARPPESQIDKLVFARLAKLHIQPALCSDAVFVRRAYLDVLGTLPTAQEAMTFIQNPDAQNKRRQLIDQLLQRPEFADYWAMKWADTLRIKAEFPVNLWPQAAQAYHEWVRTSLAQNKRYDQFAREMLTASGSNFKDGPVNFYRAVQNRTAEGIASAVALTFMGSRIESWPKVERAGMAAFFSQMGYKPTREWKEEIVFWDPLHCAKQASGSDSTPTTVPAPQQATFPDGTRTGLSADKDPREVFADWLITPHNPWFKRAIVNRIWYWLLGRGIIQEPDDIRPSNPPGNPELLSYLEKELVASHFDLKHIYRLILNSQTYQFSSVPRYTSAQAEANFATYPIRRLDAEVLIDAINKVTGTTDRYTSPIPEPFTYIPEDMPAVAVGDGSITSPFLTLFGRSSRSTGMADERNNKPLPAQALHMLNSSHIQKKLQQTPRRKAILKAHYQEPEIVIQQLYLTILSRFPTPDEMQIAEGYSAGGSEPPARQPVVILGSRVFAPRKAAMRAGMKGPKDWLDVAWSLLNTTEFSYRH